MTARYLLDASALLAWLQSEPGSDRVDAVLDQATITSVNAAEVLHKLVQKGASPEQARDILTQTLITIADFTGEMAYRMAQLAPFAKSHALSLGDRACLAAAQVLGVKALSADRRWAAVTPLAAHFELIR